MDRFLAKFLILFLLLASLSGATFLSPKQAVGSGPGATAGAMSLGPGARFGQNLPGSSKLRQFTAAGHVLGFREDGVVIASGSHALRVEFVNAWPVTPVEEVTSSGPVNGQGRAPELGKVTYRDLWDGVTVVYEKTESGVVKSTYLVQAGGAKTSDPVDEIQLRYNVPVRVDESGNLVLTLATGEMRETRPETWQDVKGKRVVVASDFRLLGDREVGFKVGAYDPQYALVIDPVLVWNTFLGGTSYDYGNGIAVDTNGNSYVIGQSGATWGSPVRLFSGSNWNVFVAKLDTNGVLQWNTFLGLGNGQGIAVDTNENPYVTGYSSATWGAPLRPFSGGGWDTFVAKLDTNGTLQWNTFLGGASYDSGQGIAVDTNGNSYVTGYSGATWGSPIRPNAGYEDAFVAKVDPAGALQWNTFLGATDDDEGWGIAVDTGGNSYVIGYGYGSWGSPIRPFSYGGWDAFVAKLSSSGALQWNTFLGGSGDDYGLGIAVDASGRSYVTGYSTDWSWGSPVRQFVQYEDAFVAKLYPNGTLQWNTFLGGITNDFGRGIAVDTIGNSYVAGNSWGHWGSPARPYAGSSDAFAARLGPDGTLHRNIFIGSSDYDYGSGVAVDTKGKYYIAGYSLATWGSPVMPMSVGYDAFVAKVGEPKVDFNMDGQEDILWRYYGAGGYNRVWFLGNSEQAALPLIMGNSQIAVGGLEGWLAGNRVSGKTDGDLQPRGVTSSGLINRAKKNKGDIMGEMDIRDPVTAVDDPRKAGRQVVEPPVMRIADPRQVKSAVLIEYSSSAVAELASTPTLLGGADIMPVGDLNWQIAAVADFNKNGTPDILWRYNGPGGYNVVWDMVGTDWNHYSPELLPVSDLNWQIAGTGDFNRDGYVDILWRYNGPGGYNVIWYMRGTSWSSSVQLISVSDLNWQIVGTGDFNKDGNVDVLWRYNGAGGFNVVWYLNNATWTGSASLISVGDLAWQIVGTGDYNNDGNVDILWRYNGAGGWNVIWYMNGVNWIESGELIPVGDLNWKIVSR